MPDLVTVIVILAALATVVSITIWNLDRFRNDGADPLVNPAWTVLARPSRRRFSKRRSKRDSAQSPDDPRQYGDTADDNPTQEK
jgi:hypothetical protein